ncbi:MAG TPA: type II toxin-antitoxin system prevent-host-death family antitoxin [Dongiaceae bacterium]|nr:type II toxin-antitoxin system prevent-host-death family antitoxin [Dongiaceae bacterium]
MSRSQTIGIRDAKANFSKLVRQIESGSTQEVVLTRAGKPVAKLVAIPKAAIRLGVADGAFPIPDDIDTANPAIEEMFTLPARRQ